jgi:predicted O-methyltransferase YrrM
MRDSRSLDGEDEGLAARTTEITPELYDYILTVGVREPEVLRRLRVETAKLEWGMMQIGPDQGQFMALLVELIGARKTIEVGVFTGYSSTAVALALPPDGRLVACDVSEQWTAIARRAWREAGVEGKIELRLQPAVRTLDELLAAGQGGTFDFAFIDADKASYDAYYERVLELLRRGGLVAIDNVLWNGAVVDAAKSDPDTEAIRALNRKIHADERVSASLIPVGDGLTLARKR